MVRWMCGIPLKSRTASAVLNRQLCIECITDVEVDCSGLVRPNEKILGSGNPTDPNFSRDPNVFMTNVFL